MIKKRIQKKFQSAEKINLYIDATNLTVCFWVMPHFGRKFTKVNNKKQTVFAIFF